MSKVSIIIPCYNNAAQLPTTLANIQAVLTPLHENGMRFDLLLVDDGSKDETWQVIQDASQKAGMKVRGMRLATNVGAYRAVVVGLLEADGDAVIVMAADGDDPPALLPRLIAEWRLGAKLVQAARSAPSGVLFNRMFSVVYYRSLRLLGVKNLPRHGSDFLLADRLVHTRVTEVGFKPGNTLIQLCQHADGAVQIPYNKGKRSGGGWNLIKKVDLFNHSLLTATGLPWPLLLLLSVIPSSVLWRMRPYDFLVIITEIEVFSMVLFVACVFPVLRYLRAFMASPSVVAARC